MRHYKAKPYTQGIMLTGDGHRDTNLPYPTGKTKQTPCTYPQHIHTGKQVDCMHMHGPLSCPKIGRHLVWLGLTPFILWIYNL